MLFEPNPKYDAYVLAKKGAERSYPFGEDVAVYKVKNKMFALMGSIGINPGYHMNKEHWNTVALDGDVPEGLIHKMIDASYDLIVAKLPKKDKEYLLGGFKR
ncbi:MmcQ/YjbR family DNA-binding protein [Ghiorsea bivora]|uniref:MmcQ/YjbR family DNA-binding protein n=1 Tax=Ghiorsea bivora TaxID=1485545 RepID=UPI00056F354B|nr:MmcQ/YjbR family DNA-binding protein [Ghiorsea bivora]